MLKSSQTIEDTDVYTLKYITKVQDIICQCMKDCDCQNDLTPYTWTGYSVFKKKGKNKTTHHNTLELAQERCQFLVENAIKLNQIDQRPSIVSVEQS